MWEAVCALVCFSCFPSPFVFPSSPRSPAPHSPSLVSPWWQTPYRKTPILPAMLSLPYPRALVGRPVGSALYLAGEQTAHALVAAVRGF